MELTDDAIIKALTRAGVPKRYRSKEVHLTDLGERGARALEAVRQKPTLGSKLITGGVKEISGTEAETSDLFYLIVRSLVISRCPIRIVSGFNFIDADEEFIPSLVENRVLAITALSIPPHQDDPYGSHRPLIEWQLTNWLNEDRGLVILSDGEINGDERWSERFRSTLATRKIDFDVRW